MRSQNRRRDSGSTPPVGSSRNTIGGSCRMAQPSASRCRQPPGRSRVSVFSRPSSPAISSTNCAGAPRSARPTGRRCRRRTGCSDRRSAARRARTAATCSRCGASRPRDRGRRRCRRPARCRRSAAAGRTACGWSWTCRRRWRRGSRRSRPACTENDRSFTATKSPNVRVRPRTSMAGQAQLQGRGSWSLARSQARDAAAPRPAARRPARACAPVRLEQRHLRVERRRCSSRRRRRNGRRRPAAPRSALRTASAAASTMALARVEIEQPLPDVGRDDASRTPPAARAVAAAAAAASATCALVRPKSKNGQLTFNADVPRLLPDVLPREDARVRASRSPRPAPTATTGLLPVAAACCAGFDAAQPQRQRLALGPLGERLLDQRRATSVAPACRPAASSGSARSIDRLLRDADQAPQFDQRAIRAGCCASISCACSRDRCASRLDTSLGGIRPTSKRWRASRSCASARAADSSSTRTASRAVAAAQIGAHDLEAQVGACRVDVGGRGLRLGVGGALERIDTAGGVDRPLQSRGASRSCRECRDTRRNAQWAG